MRTCRRYAETEPSIWLKALDYLVTAAPAGLSGGDDGTATDGGGAPNESGGGGDTGAADARAWRAQMSEVLAAIDADELLPPTELVERLCRGSGGVPLGVVSEVLERHLRASEAAASEQQREVDRWNEEDRKMHAELAEISVGSKTFQLAKCSACHGPLELPAVHFMCGHSYRPECLGDAENPQCMLCAPQRKRIAEAKEQQRALARQPPSELFGGMSNASDPFAVIAELIGRGALIGVAGE